MNKHFFILLGMLCISLSSQAQLQLGVNMTYSDMMGRPQVASLTDNRGYQVMDLKFEGVDNHVSYGLSAYAENELLFFMSSINYKETNYRYSVRDMMIEADVVKSASVKTQALHIPITAGLKVDKFRIGVGPDFNYILDSQETLSQHSDIHYNERSLRSGFHFLVGYDPIPNVKLSVGYELSFNNVTNDYRQAGKVIHLDATPKLLNFSLALFL